MLIDLVKCIDTQYCGEKEESWFYYTEDKRGSEFSYDSHTYIRPKKPTVHEKYCKSKKYFIPLTWKTSQLSLTYLKHAYNT